MPREGFVEPSRPQKRFLTRVRSSAFKENIFWLVGIPKLFLVSFFVQIE